MGLARRSARQTHWPRPPCPSDVPPLSLFTLFAGPSPAHVDLLVVVVALLPPAPTKTVMRRTRDPAFSRYWCSAPPPPSSFVAGWAVVRSPRASSTNHRTYHETKNANLEFAYYVVYFSCRLLIFYSKRQLLQQLHPLLLPKPTLCPYTLPQPHKYSKSQHAQESTLAKSPSAHARAPAAARAEELSF